MYLYISEGKGCLKKLLKKWLVPELTQSKTRDKHIGEDVESITNRDALAKSGIVSS